MTRVITAALLLAWRGVPMRLFLSPTRPLPPPPPAPDLSPPEALRVDLTTAIPVSFALRGLLKSSLGAPLVRRLCSHQQGLKKQGLRPRGVDGAELALLLNVYAGVVR